MKLAGGIFFALVILLSFAEKEDIVRMNQPSVFKEIVKTDTLLIDINDTIPNKCLIVYLDKLGNPVKYSRNIITGVCIEGKCRMVKIDLFWNITGRYLGFELPNGEFLSKTEHHPFTTGEYNRLHELLADKNSALAAYTIDELVPVKDSTSKKVDAVSSATITAVLDYIVEGAVYTTYTLWHIVYGPTKKEIEKYSTKKLNANLVLDILNSKKLEDRVWALNHMSAETPLTDELLKKLLEQISGKDVYLAERSLNALRTESLSPEVQSQLASVFSDSGFLQQRLILQKLKEAQNLNPGVISHISSGLENLNGALVKNALELFNIHKIKDVNTLLRISGLLKNDNRYIANQAFAYLDNLEIKDKKILKNINKYKKKNQ